MELGYYSFKTLKIAFKEALHKQDSFTVSQLMPRLLVCKDHENLIGREKEILAVMLTTSEAAGDALIEFYKNCDKFYKVLEGR